MITAEKVKSLESTFSSKTQSKTSMVSSSKVQKPAKKVRSSSQEIQSIQRVPSKISDKTKSHKIDQEKAESLQGVASAENVSRVQSLVDCVSKNSILTNDITISSARKVRIYLRRTFFIYSHDSK